jgi:hypothetical protein
MKDQSVPRRTYLKWISPEWRLRQKGAWLRIAAAKRGVPPDACVNGAILGDYVALDS